MKKIGFLMLIIAVVLLVTWFIFPLNILYIPMIILWIAGIIIIGIAPRSKAVRSGPLVRGTVINERYSSGGGYDQYGAYSRTNFRYTVQYTTVDGQQITSKTTAPANWDKGETVPVRYNPKKPKQFMIDTNADSHGFQNPNDLGTDVQSAIASALSGLGAKGGVNFTGTTVTTTVNSVPVNNVPVGQTQAKGVVLSVQPTGNIVADNGEIELKIEVTRPDGSQYQTTVKKAIPPIALPYIQVGRVIQVFYKPEDEQNITIGL
ncbi:MAG: DUF3592 domain-containing protein [Desulfuromonadales bacterium]|nr:DUF3592 domain-containing protein [Desulfuromonadales bacterium]